MGIFDDVHVTDDNQPLGDHLIDKGEKVAQLVGGINGRQHN